MKGKLRFEIPVGMLFLIAMGILIYYTIIMSHEFIKPEETYPMSVIFPNTTGLGKKDKVKINGVDSGYVDEIRLVDNQVWVTIRMYNTFTLYENYKIKVKMDSILVGKHVSVYPGSKRGRGGMLHAVIQKRKKLKGDIDDPLGAFSALIDENRQNLFVTINNIKEITGKINRGKGTIGKLLNDDKLHAETDMMLKDLRESIEDTREQAPITSFLRAALTFF